MVIIQTFPPLFSTLLWHDLDIDPLQSTTGTGGESDTLVPDCCLILRGQRRVTFFCDWPAGRQPDSDWQAGKQIRCLRKKNEPIEAGTEVGGGAVAVGEGGREEVTGASLGLTQSDRLAGTNTQTHRAFMAGCFAEHTQCAACLRTRGKRNDR